MYNMPNIVTGFKATNFDMTCRGYQFRMNQIFSCYGNIRLCSNGFHFCKNIIDVFNYYSCPDRMFIIEARGKMDHGRDKSCCEFISFVRELTEHEIIDLSLDDIINGKDMPNSFRNYLFHDIKRLKPHFKKLNQAACTRPLQFSFNYRSIPYQFYDHGILLDAFLPYLTYKQQLHYAKFKHVSKKFFTIEDVKAHTGKAALSNHAIDHPDDNVKLKCVNYNHCGHNELKKSPNLKIRVAIAKNSSDWDILNYMSKDKSWEVRKQIAKRGYFTNRFLGDSNQKVVDAAISASVKGIKN